MTTRNKLTLLLCGLALGGSAFAADMNNWRNAAGDLQWKTGDGSLCWRTNAWTPATAAPGCDGSIAPAVVVPKAPPAAVQPVAPAPVAPVSAPAPKPTPAPVVTKVTYAADPLFTTNSATLKPAGKAKLDDLLAKLKGVNLDVIVAMGHAAAGEKGAKALSVKRAEAVKAYLVAKGIEKNRVYTEGKGDKQAVADNKTKEGKAKNRRVEVEVVGTRTNK